MGTITPLLLAFITLAIVSVMIDKFTLFLEGIMKHVPYLPDHFEWTVAYLLVLGSGYLFCWQGNFDLFRELNVFFKYQWEGWLMTALVVSGGSAFVRKQFHVIEQIPNAARGMASYVTSTFTSLTNGTTNDDVTPPQDQSGPL